MTLGSPMLSLINHLKFATFKPITDEKKKSKNHLTNHDPQSMTYACTLGK